MHANACFFFFNDTATTEIYTLSLHDALPIYLQYAGRNRPARNNVEQPACGHPGPEEGHQAGDDTHRSFGQRKPPRSEEHTSELQSRQYLVCRLLLEKKKKPL